MEYNKVLVLEKSLYGLVQAARSWLKTFIKHLMESLGFERSMADPCLLMKKNKKKKLVLIVIVYVDDCAVGGEPQWIKWFGDEVGKRFRLKAMGVLSEFIGATIKRTRRGFTISQLKLIESLEERFNVPQGYWSTPAAPGKILMKDQDKLLNNDMSSTYRSGVGKLLYLIKLSRPELASAVRELSKFTDYSTIDHFQSMHRAMRYLIDTKHYVLTLTPNEEFKNVIMGFSDSNYATDKDGRRSISGFAIYYCGALVSWKSKMQQCVTLSSTEAEYVAASQCVSEMEFVRQVVESMGLKVQFPMTLYVDNTGAIDLAENWSTTGRTKHIDVRFHYLREMNERGMVEIKFVKSELNVSDIFTKNLSEKLFHHHAETLGIFPCDKEGVNIDNNVVSHENKGSQGVDRRNAASDDEKFKEETSVVL